MPNSTDAARIDTPGHTSIRTPSTRATMPISSCGTHISRSGFGVAVVVIAVTFHLAGSSMLAAPTRAVIGTKGHQKVPIVTFVGPFFRPGCGRRSPCNAAHVSHVDCGASTDHHHPIRQHFGHWEWGE